MANERFESVWDALFDDVEEAANLKLRSELMQQIVQKINNAGWNQFETAQHCNINQPRVSDLRRGLISKFSLDALVNIAASLKMNIQLTIHEMETAEAA